MVPMIVSEMGLGAPEMDQDLGEADLLRAMWIGCCCLCADAMVPEVAFLEGGDDCSKDPVHALV